jgi:hypothetical protein
VGHMGRHLFEIEVDDRLWARSGAVLVIGKVFGFHCLSRMRPV